MGIPLEQQRLHRDALTFLLEERSVGHALRGGDLLRAVEDWAGRRLPSSLRALFPEFATSPRGDQGRKAEKRAKEDFVMEEMDARYEELLKLYQAEEQPNRSADYLPPSARVYFELLRERAADFGPITWEALRNRHSAWRTARSYPIEKLGTSEDYEAEIDRQFPPPGHVT